MFAFSTLAQKSKIDSLYTTIPFEHDTSKSKTYSYIARKLGPNYPDSAYAIADSALKFALRSNFKSGEAEAYFILGFVSFNKGKYDLCITNFDKSLKIYQALKNKNATSNLNNSLGNVYTELGKMDLAVTYYSRARDIALEEPRNKFMEALSNSGLALVLSEQNKYYESIKTFEKSRTLYQEMNNVFQEALTVINIADVYLKLKDYKKATQYCNQGINVFKNLNDNYTLATAYALKSQILAAEGHTEEAIKFLQMSYSINLTRDAWPELSGNSKELSALYARKGDYKNSVTYLNEYIKYHDSLNNENRRKIIADADSKYQSKEKEQQIMVKNAELERSQLQVNQRNKLIYIFGGALIIFLTLLFLVFKQYSEKTKANILLVNKNDEIHKQKHTIEEKNKDITDSINYSRHIQQAIIPSPDKIKKALPDAFVLFKPKDIVSGDFYFLETLNNHIYLAVIDCTGHGVPGAMLSVFAHSSLKNTIINNSYEMNPAAILKEMCAQFKANLLSNGSNISLNDGVDMGLCILDKSKMKMVFAGAKNNLLRVNNKLLIEYKGERYGISGSNSENQFIFTNHLIEICDGDKFYLHTDGIIDQFGGPRTKKFMQKQLNNLLSENGHLEMKAQEGIVNEKFAEWKGSLEQIDDVTLIGFQI